MELGKVPPHDIEAEQAILGCMLTDKDSVISAIEVLKEEDFYREDNKTIYFALGGHPAFKTPLYPNEEFTDYYLEFSSPKKAQKMDVLKGKNPNDPFDGKCFQTIPLKHEVFDYDDMFFYNTAKSVSLKSKNHDRSVTVDFEGFKYIGFWQMQYVKPPYLCIEPWTGSPSKKGIIDDLETKEDNFSLDTNKSFSISYKIILT
jgi:galactose mutarotase-like enzyme